MIHANVQIWRVAISFLKSTKVVELSNPHNCNYEELRFERQKPERRKCLKAQKRPEWAVKRSNSYRCFKGLRLPDDSQVGHSSISPVMGRVRYEGCHKLCCQNLVGSYRIPVELFCCSGLELQRQNLQLMQNCFQSHLQYV